MRLRVEARGGDFATLSVALAHSFNSGKCVVTTVGRLRGEPRDERLRERQASTGSVPEEVTSSRRTSERSPAASARIWTEFETMPGER